MTEEIPPNWVRMAEVARITVAVLPADFVRSLIAAGRDCDDPDIEEQACQGVLADVLELVLDGQDPAPYLVALERRLVEAEDWAVAKLTEEAGEWLEDQ